MFLQVQAPKKKRILRNTIKQLFKRSKNIKEK